VILQFVPEHGLIKMPLFREVGPCLVLEDHRSKVARVMADQHVIPLLVATLTAA